MNEAVAAFGIPRGRGATVSYADVERVARGLMAAGSRPTVNAVLESLGRGSPNHITDCMQRFWKDQAALNSGDPVALSRIPPELAEATQAIWEQALRLSQQTARQEGNEASARLEALRRDTDARSRSIELREKEWDLAARVRERALVDAREQVNVLLRELAKTSADLRASRAETATVQSQLEDYRRRLATVVVRSRVPVPKKPPKRKAKRTRRAKAATRVKPKPTRPRRSR